MTRAAITPTAKYEKKCESCSLLWHCMPKTTGRKRSANAYLARAVADELNGE